MFTMAGAKRLTMNDPLFKNWLKAAYAFKYLKSGLEDFASIQVTEGYNQLKKTLYQPCPQCSLLKHTECQHILPCSVCTSNNLLPDHGANGCRRRDCFCSKHHRKRRKCPNNFCSVFYDLVVDDHVYRTPRWSSTDISVWYLDDLQYAKCFLGTDSPATCIKELDCTGVLSIIVHNCHIHRSINDVNLFKKCRQDRNDIFHTGNYEITDQEVNAYIDDMINALEDSNTLINDRTAKACVRDLNKLRNDQIFITDVDIVELVQDSCAAINDLSDNVKQDIENKRKQVLEDFDLYYADAIKEFKKLQDDAVRQLSERGNKVIDTIDEHKDDAVRHLSEQGNKVIDTIDEHKDDAVHQLSEQGNKVIDTIDEHKDDAVHQLSEQGNKVIDTIDEHKDDAVHQLSEQGNKVIDTIDKHKDDAVRQFSDYRDEAISRIKQASSTTTGIRSEEPDQLQCPQHLAYKRVVDNNRSLLLEYLDPTSTLDAFVEIKYISTIQYRDISELQTTSMKIRKILDIVKLKGPKGYDDFKGCLKTSNQGDLAEILEDTEIALADGLDNPVPNTKTAVDRMERLKQTKQSRDKHTDIQQKLMNIYQRDCRLLQVSPFIEDDNGELMCMYQRPTLHHRDLQKDKIENISSYEEIFCKKDETFKRVYITGDAGVGKTSLCRRMCLLWSMSRLGNYDGNDEHMKKDIKYLEKFDFLFHVSLGASDRRDMIMMIIDQLFYTECEAERTSMYTLIKHILDQRACLVVLDGFDEWTPKMSGKFDAKTPKGIESEKCVFLTMCRPYKLENVRLSGKDIDHQVEMTGIHGSSAKHYVAKVVEYMNKKNKDNRNPEQFLREIERCGLYEHLCIPMVSSHLIVVWWFNQKLTHVSKSVLYGKIVEMLFKRAERKVEFPSSAACEHKLPDCFSPLDYMNIHEHVSLLQKVCLLSFNSLFQQDACASTLVFTKRQLMSSPYLFTTDEMDFVCKVGIISKNKVIGCFEDPKQKLSFVHKSYIEFFGALYVSSFDSSNRIDSIVKEWTSLDDVLQYANFFQFLAGLSSQKLNVLLENRYTFLSDHLNSWRKYSIFNCEFPNFYQNQLNLLQTAVVTCFIECSRSNDQNVYLKLEDFIIDNNYDVDILRQLLLLNTTCVKSVCSAQGKYYDEFDEIKDLQCLHVGKVLSENVVKFTKCMLSNQSTLHTVCIDGTHSTHPLLPELPVRSLHQLTSLSLCKVTIQHEQLHDLVTFLSDNVHFEHLKLYRVHCDKHRFDDSKCAINLNIQQHSTLRSLWLYCVNISCSYVNTTSLKSVTLRPLSERISHDYINVFNSLKDSQIEHLDIDGDYMLDDETLRSLTTAVKSLSSLKHLTLRWMKFPSDILLHLHCDTIPVKIDLEVVTMSRQCFQCFIESLVNKKSVIKVELHGCTITSVDGEPRRQLFWEESMKESVDYMAEWLSSIQTVNITLIDDSWLYFETTSCQ